MVFEFLSSLDITTGFLILIIFVLFILALRKVFGILKNAFIIFVASILFPVIGNRVLGLAIPSDLSSIASFAIFGLFIYFLYLMGSWIYKGLSLVEKIAGGKNKDLEEPEVVYGGNRSVPVKEEIAVEIPTIPVIHRKKQKKNWEKEFVVLEEEKVEKKTAKKTKPEKKPSKRKKKQEDYYEIEELPVIGEDKE